MSIAEIVILVIALFCYHIETHTLWIIHGTYQYLYQNVIPLIYQSKLCTENKREIEKAKNIDIIKLNRYYNNVYYFSDIAIATIVSNIIFSIWTHFEVYNNIANVIIIGLNAFSVVVCFHTIKWKRDIKDIWAAYVSLNQLLKDTKQ